MRPVKLKIRGLNSFIEEQTIDFEKLTQCGLFGIFGPTGSGKSSILDGMTLALYGDIARKSSNYINTNCESLQVSYEFKISGEQTHYYRVSRSFKRDKKTGNPKTHSAKVIEYINNQENILAEGATAVNKKCTEIIGLGLEDFTRTVVLPQGKFSEFLRLEGKQRREMLERLFNLEEYGEKLTKKLTSRINKEKTQYNQLIGEVKGYEEITSERVKEKEAEQEEWTAKVKQLEKDLEQFNKQYKIYEEIWDLQEELKKCESQQSLLEERSQQIEEKQKQYAKGESALKVSPFLKNYEIVQEELQISEAKLEKQKEKVEKLTNSRKKVEELYEKANTRKNSEVTHLTLKSQQLENIKEHIDTLIVEDGNLNDSRNKMKYLLGLTEESRQKLKSIEEKLKVDNKALKENEIQRQNLKVDETLRHQLQETLQILKEFELKSEDNEQEIKKIDELHERIQNKKMKEQTLIKEQKELTKQLENWKDKQDVLQQMLPHLQDEILDKQTKFVRLQEQQKRMQALKEEEKQGKNKEKNVQEQWQAIKGEKEKITKEVASLSEKLKTLMVRRLAYDLREDLKEGEACPVCGALHHHLDKIHLEGESHKEEIENLEKLLQSKQQCLEQINAKYITLEAQKNGIYDTLQKIELEIQSLEEQFAQNNLEQMHNELQELKIRKEEMDSQGAQAQKELSKLSDQKANIDMKFATNQKEQELAGKQLQESMDKSGRNKQELRTLSMTLEERKMTFGRTDFKAFAKEIEIQDKQREELESKAKELTKAKEEEEKLKEEQQSKLVRYEANKAKGENQIENNVKNRQSVIKKIADQLKNSLDDEEGMELLEQYQNEGFERETLYRILDQETSIFYERLKQMINNKYNQTKEMCEEIEIEYKKAEENRTLVSKAHEEAGKEYVEIESRKQELHKRFLQDKEQLEKILQEEEISKEDVKVYFLDKETLEKLQADITQYHNECEKLKGARERIVKKLAGRNAEEVTWENLKKEKIQREQQFKEENKKLIELATRVNQLQEGLKKLGQLLKQKEDKEHKLAILADLDKIFKGKRFVEFVATHRLKYISIEASKRLQEITNGIYGLEVDENSKFVIRDYKNGGVARDASTLSGGETFLASLALALALSAEIQLKGTAPLELFFLDEGFGTLDDDLLEIVMSSLERIHHDKLKVGIITHVEAIKNRVPIKLILTPAESGRGGTKVKLERS